MTKPIRVRFAPSPTGFLHVGGARTALFNWLWARKNKGTFILRIEDTDVERSTDASVDQIFESMKWLGLDWDEGPYFQSQRLDIYREHLQRLIDSKHVYPAFETKEELDAMRALAEAEKRNPIYDRRSLNLPPAEVQRLMETGTPFVWRFRVPDEGYTDVPETLMGGNAECRFHNPDIGDFVITRPGTLANPGMPLYNFVCVVDDALMDITHVIRGADHLSNTAKQVLMYQALGFEIPSFTHLPLILKNNKKMSKRDADADPRTPVSVSARRDLGYLRESTLNFLALLGWSFPGDRELFTVEELIETFTLERLVKSNANFDEDKYLFQNGWYIRNMPRPEIVARVKPFLAARGLSADGRSDEWLGKVIELEIERCRLLSDFADALEYFFKAPGSIDPKGVKKFLGDPAMADTLNAVADILAGLEPFAKDAMEAPLREMAEARGLGFGKIAQPIRLAVTGRTASPGLFEVLELLGREESVSRIRGVAGRLAAGTLAAE